MSLHILRPYKKRFQNKFKLYTPYYLLSTQIRYCDSKFYISNKNLNHFKLQDCRSIEFFRLKSIVKIHKQLKLDVNSVIIFIILGCILYIYNLSMYITKIGAP